MVAHTVVARSYTKLEHGVFEKRWDVDIYESVRTSRKGQGHAEKIESFKFGSDALFEASQAY